MTGFDREYSSRTLPGAVDIVGDAHAAATVTVNLQPAARQGEYFWKELQVPNTNGPVWQAVTVIGVLQQGTNADIVTTNLGQVYVPQTPEAFAYDADGNLTNDGR
ncbi:MAG: hypothetical protein NZM03_07925 [Limisphaera sp.]|nr:hypothetical protein [Limisphaera sp.]